MWPSSAFPSAALQNVVPVAAVDSVEVVGAPHQVGSVGADGYVKVGVPAALPSQLTAFKASAAPHESSTANAIDANRIAVLPIPFTLRRWDGERERQAPPLLASMG